MLRNSKINKRHQGVTLESMDSKIDLVLEGFHSLDVKIDKNRNEFKEFKGEINYKLDLTLEQLGVIRNDLKQKVGRDEFILLEKRVEHLEKLVSK
ncbi:MAG: hypothetical protein AAB928_00685 [Patescibacteria group bacterium]